MYKYESILNAYLRINRNCRYIHRGTQRKHVSDVVRDERVIISADDYYAL
jgi:hypothetical protein